MTVEDRNYIQFFVGDTRVVDTLGDNRRQLDKITGLMRQIVEQQEFWVDTITLTAASSPEGAYAFNDRLSQGRAAALKRYLVRRYGRSIDTMLTGAVGGRRLGGIDEPHPNRPGDRKP